MVAKKLSATALSQHSPLRPTESTTPLARASSAKSPTRILTAAVRMENDALLWCPVGEGHGEGVFDQLGAHVIGQGPADDPAGGQVDDRRQVGPALPGRDVGDVADIAPVHFFARPEVALDEIAGRLGFGSATVVLRQRFLHRPSRPAWRISLVTLRLPAATWRCRSSLWIRGAP